MGAERKRDQDNVRNFLCQPRHRNRPRRRLHHRDAPRQQRNLSDRLNRGTEVNNRFLINRRDAKIMGVGAGIADYTGIDPLIVRLALVAALLVTGPLVLILYLVTGLVAAQQ
jgi:phage shock protein C